MVAKAVAKKDRNIIYVATTYNQARDIAWQRLKKVVEPVISNSNESRLEIVLNTVDGGTSKISLRGWEAIETLRGQKVDFAVIDEVASMKDFDLNWEEVIKPTLLDTTGEVMFISTPKGYNHFYALCNKELTDNNYKSFHFTTYDNSYMPIASIENEKMTMTDDRFAQEYLADFRKTEGLVYKEFTRENCLYNDQTPRDNIIEVLAGVDFGFSNPCAVITIEKDYSDNYWISEEWYHTGKTDAQVAEYVGAIRPTKIYPDPESPTAIAELKKQRLNVRDVVKGKDSVKNGIDKVRELLKAGKLKVHQKCVNVIREFEMYAYPEERDIRTEKGKELPLKENDHSMDAIRYVLMMSSNDRRVAQTYVPSGLNRVPSFNKSLTAHQFFPKFKK
jgi:PBSX family phage terminase large subunit